MKPRSHQRTAAPPTPTDAPHPRTPVRPIRRRGNPAPHLGVLEVRKDVVHNLCACHGVLHILGINVHHFGARAARPHRRAIACGPGGEAAAFTPPPCRQTGCLAVAAAVPFHARALSQRPRSAAQRCARCSPGCGSCTHTGARGRRGRTWQLQAKPSLAGDLLRPVVLRATDGGGVGAR